MNTLKYTALAAVIAASAIFQSTAVAQDAPRERGERERGGDRRGGNPEEFRQRMNERLKSSLKASDEEWTVIQPLIEKVTTKQREAMGSRFGGFGGGRGGDRGGDQSTRSQRPGAAESEALRTALENDSASPEELKTKLTAVRESRKRSQAELDQAREELRKVLTVRQEAALVNMGVLE